MEDLALQPGDVIFQDVDVPLDDKERLELEMFFAQDE